MFQTAIFYYIHNVNILLSVYSNCFKRLIVYIINFNGYNLNFSKTENTTLN